MHLRLIVLLGVVCFLGQVFGAATKADDDSSSTSSSLKPKGFESRSIEETEDDFETQAQTHLGYRQQQQQQQQRQLYDYSQSEEDQEEPPRQVYQSRNNYRQQQQQQNSFVKQQQPQKTSSEEETEEELEEPDRLSQLLAKSNFNCNSKNSGYYADESLNCEVFHYCQENQRHSWICPEGFTFHQIHLICMPPSNDNICQQSSKYHIVNDYLYKPINLQEHQNKPNVTLRYSDRYFPENYYENDRYSDEEEEAPKQRIHHQPRQPIQVGFQQQAQQHAQVHAQPQQQPQYQRPVTQQIRQQSAIPSPTTPLYRKPVPTTTIQPQISTLQHHLQSPQQQQQPQIRLQTAAPIATPTPTPYRFFSAAPQLQQHVQQQHQVFRTPEEINISLQQRRPQVFIATTPRYYEDEYLYERK